jgi:Fe-S oxidoreductase
MFDTYAPGGRMWLIRGWLNGDLANTERLQHIIFACATCGNCVEHCAFNFRDELVNVFIAAREEMVNTGIIPPAVRDYLRAIYVNGNPYKEPADERGKWADGSGVERYNGHEYLFYVGCVGSYDERGKTIARAVAGLLARAGISFGILGSDELCDGNEVRVLGEMGLFQHLAAQNIALFKERGVHMVITLDPHALHAFVTEYPELGAEVVAYHYSQVVAPLVQSGTLRLPEFKAKITYHDPCYLGRHHGEYHTPRTILEAIPGAELVEMEQHGANAFCCGGGGGNFFTDILGGGADAPNRVRIRQAHSTGAEIVAVACPQCAKMLQDAIAAEALEEEIRVMDVAELALGASG